MKLVFSARADTDLGSMDSGIKAIFLGHFEKLERMPPRRHMGLGLPVCVENVTRQARIVYKFEEETITIVRCFSTHKEYERWFRRFG